MEVCSPVLQQLEVRVCREGCVRTGSISNSTSDSRVLELEFGVGGKLLVVTADDGTLVVLSVAGRNEVRVHGCCHGKNVHVTSLCTHFKCAGTVWSVLRGTSCCLRLQVMRKQFGSGLTSCAFSSETSVLCGASDGQIIEVDLRNIRSVLCNHCVFLGLIHNCCSWVLLNS